MWFLRTTLQGKLFPNSKIEEGIFENTIKSLVVWVFEEEILVTFAKIDSEVFLEILFMFFLSKPA